MITDDGDGQRGSQREKGELDSRRRTRAIWTDDEDVARVLHNLVQVRQVVFPAARRSEEHTSELQSQGHISYAVFCLKK